MPHEDSASAPHATPDPKLLALLGQADPQRRKRQRVLRWALTLTILTGLGLGGRELLHARRLGERPVFKTMPVEDVDLRVTVSATGTLEGLNTVEVGSEVSGKVAEVLVDFNDPVKQGQVLAVLDPEQSKASVDEAGAQVASATAAILQARASEVEALQKLERATGQKAAGLLADQDYETLVATAARATAAVGSAKASSTLARASLKLAGSRLEKTTIVSPIDGVVLARLVENGQTIAAGMTTPVLFKLAQDLRKMRLSVAVDEADIGRVREGQEARFTVDAYPDKTFPSKVLSLRNNPLTVQNVVTYAAILAVDNVELLLRPGMTAAATIIIETRHATLSVPNAALRFAPSPELRKQLGMPDAPHGRQKGGTPELKGTQVWVVHGLMPKATAISVGVTDGAFTELLGGTLKRGVEVIVDVEEKKR